MGKSKAIDIGDYAHIYNRGVDKRNVVNNLDDLKRFLESMQEFNTNKPIGSIRDKTSSSRGSTSGI